jgi:hypothetical protein
VKDRLVELERQRDELAQRLVAYNAVIGELQALLIDEDGEEELDD